MSRPERPSLQAQHDEVMGHYLARRAWARQRELAIAGGRKVPPDTGCAVAGLPALAAAVETLAWVRDHADVLRQLAPQIRALAEAREPTPEQTQNADGEAA